MQNQGNGALSLLPPIGPSAQNATAPFVAADTAARGDMCVRSNQVHPVGPASARRPAIVVLPTYCQSAGTTGRILLVLVRHSVVSIATAWCLAYLFTLGNIFCGKSPSQQSYRSFLTATFVLGTVCLAQVMLMVQVISMSTLHRTESPTKLIPLLLLAWRFESQTFVAFILMEAVSVLITYAFASANETLRPWHFEFYLQTWVVGLHTAAVYVERKRIYQLETAEGCAVGRVNKMPYYKRYFNSYLQTSLNPIAISVAAFLVHGSLHLRITTNSELILMSLAGIFIKSTTLRAIKLIVLRKRKKIDSKGIYVFTVVPTVLINTQLRLLLLRARPQQTVWGFILLAILEPVLRFIKTKDVLRELQRQRRQGGVLTRRSSAMWQPVALAVAISTPNTSAATANPASPRTSNLQGRHEGNSPAQRNSSQTTRRQAYTQWRTTMLQFLAAELEAVSQSVF